MGNKKNSTIKDQSSDMLEKLKKENQELQEKLEIKEREFRDFMNQLKESYELRVEKVKREKEATFNESIQIAKLMQDVQTWEKIVDEIAHSINTDVFIAVNNLSKFLDNPKIKKAYHHTNQIREITNLLMWYIKRNELEISGEMADIYPAQILNEQTELVREGLSTLRISSDDHHENLLKMEVPQVESEARISVTKEIKESIPLILKDFVRNAYKNTDEDNPVVTCSVENDSENVIIKITNNQAVAQQYADWFNGKTASEPETISKSFKVGLRVIKIWISLLNIDARLIPDKTNNSTTAIIKLPMVIKYEKN